MPLHNEHTEIIDINIQLWSNLPFGADFNQQIQSAFRRIFPRKKAFNEGKQWIKFLLVRGRKKKKLQCGFDSLKLSCCAAGSGWRLPGDFSSETFPSLKILKVFFSALNFVSKRSEKTFGRKTSISVSNPFLSPRIFRQLPNQSNRKENAKESRKKNYFRIGKSFGAKTFSCVRWKSLGMAAASWLIFLPLMGQKFSSATSFAFFSFLPLPFVMSRPSVGMKLKKVSSTHSPNLIYIFLLSPQLKCNQSPSKERQKGLERRSKKQKLWMRIRRKP